MHKTKPIITLTTIVIATYSIIGCSKQSIEVQASKMNFQSGEVGFYVEKNTTKTVVSENGTSLEWVNGDKSYLWAARKDNSSLILNKREFTAFAGSGLRRAYFTATLDTPMSDGTYLYAACYPAPTEANGTEIEFVLPKTQDGNVGSVDFMVTGIAESGALTPIKENEDYTGLRLGFSHKFHLLRFFIPEEHAGAEKGLTSFEVCAPAAINGSYQTDILSQDSESYTPADKAGVIEMNLTSALFPSSEDDRQYAYAAILPFSSSEGDQLTFRTNPINSKTEFSPIDLKGRTFQAGHVTSVAIRPIITDVRDFAIKLTGNNCGEPIRTLRITGPEGLIWDESGSNVIEITPSDSVSHNVDIIRRYKLSDALYSNIDSELQIELLSEHIKFTDSMVIDQTNKDNFHLGKSVAAPYLLFEDFSTLESFNNKSDYETSSTGNDYNTSFHNGWSGGRVGGSAGKCVRIAGRRECGLYIDAHYWARMDSAPLNGEIIAPVEIEVSFSYGTDERGSSVGSSYKYLGQEFQVGYITTEDVLASGNGTINDATSVKVAAGERGGSYDSVTKKMKATVTLEPGNAVNRISWRNNPAGKSEFGGNTTAWLYVDNVVVRVKKK